jgi:uncharacterized protein YjcR
MKKIIFISAFMLLASISVLNAQTATPKITSRQVKQQDRIEQGTDNKELTRSETARLERAQKRIQIEKKMAKSDGTVTPKERRFLKREQNRASRDIYKQKHDVQLR